MPHLTAAQRHQLRDALLALPNSDDRAVRNAWLHDLPPGLRSNIPRSDIPGTDVENMLVKVADWDDDGTALGQLLATAAAPSVGSASAHTIVTLAADLRLPSEDQPSVPPAAPRNATQQQQFYHALRALDDTHWMTLLSSSGLSEADLHGPTRALKINSFLNQWTHPLFVLKNMVTDLAADQAATKKALHEAAVIRQAQIAQLLSQLASAEAARDRDRTIDLGERILALDPQHGEARTRTAAAYNRQGTGYYKKKDYDQAIANYTRAIDLDPHGLFYGSRANSYAANGDHERAIDDYTRAISLEPQRAYYYALRGEHYYFKRDFDRAIADFTRAIKLAPNDGSYY